MPPGPDQQRLRPEERANLVAYIDGELTETESRALSTKITHSATARREVELLKKTWEALDKLPRPQISDQFQDRTLTYVRSIQIRQGTRLEPLAGSFTAALKIAACLFLVGSTGAGGYFAVRNFWPDPDARVIRDLSVAEHLDEYLEVGRFELLDALKNSPEFGPGR
ncbi:hypothetical protein [Paludisphaera mucosa]|uniref:Zinc-finger domain-containing protein n=1 Tax=Paludisphaera mucosa TaxID=3030827 RepID=A0ABT6F659_9BACT|nr:hypothetical protein [Paludisphaera mucosa]MDG3002908.1 hypothetical protein [Paludisphaera mucosa]